MKLLVLRHLLPAISTILYKGDVLIPVHFGVSLEQEPVDTQQMKPAALSVTFHSVETVKNHHTFAETPPSPLPLRRREPAHSTVPEHSDRMLLVVAGGCSGKLPS